MPTRSLSFRAILLSLLATAVAPSVAPALSGDPASAAPEPGEGAERRLVAIGDVHGDYPALLALLRKTGLVDADEGWAGGDAILVQTGDLLDRGSDVRSVMDLLMRLQAEARAHGGRVHVLLGNHEVLNLLGEVRDVSPEAYAAFAGPESDELLEEAFDDYEDAILRRQRGWRRASRQQRRQVELQWRHDRPPGFVEYMRALAPAGEYGRWLRRLPMAVRVGELLFIHAGIPPPLADWSLQALNDRVADEIALFDAYRRYLVEEGRVPEPATLGDVFAGAIDAVGGVEWLDDRPVPESPPPLPSIDLRAVPDERDRLEPLMRIESWFLLAEDGPLWFRGLARWSEEEGVKYLPAILESHEVRAIVSGHTPQLGGIRARWGGRTLLIDTGMLSSHYGGGGRALEVRGGRAAVIHESGRRVELRLAIDLGPIPAAERQAAGDTPTE